MNFRDNRKISFLIILGLLFLLLVSPPARAVNLSIQSFNEPNPVKGIVVSTSAKIDIKANDKVHLNGSVNLTIDDIVYCILKLDGTHKECLEGANISLFSSEDKLLYGYGYNENVEFNITIDTSKFSEGLRLVELFFEFNNQLYNAKTWINIRADTKYSMIRPVYNVLDDKSIFLEPVIYTSSNHSFNESKVIYLNVDQELTSQRKIEWQLLILILIADVLIIFIINIIIYKRKKLYENRQLLF
jgi:hypothetical protein